MQAWIDLMNYVNNDLRKCTGENMTIKLRSFTENFQSFAVEIDDTVLDGEITNRSVHGGFVYKTNDYSHQLNSKQLRLVAERLDELNQN